FLAYGNAVTPARGHRRPHHRHVHPPALDLGAHAIPQLALPGGVLPRRSDADVEVTLVDATNLDRDPRPGCLRRAGTEAGHGAHGVLPSPWVPLPLADRSRPLRGGDRGGAALPDPA